MVADEREELATPERFPGCAIQVTDPASWVRRQVFGERDWLLIATHDHQLDEEILGLALAQKPRYIGLVGSRRKVFRFLQRISARLPGLDLGRLYAPVGLDIGAVGPEEIAVSIMGELVALRHGKERPTPARGRRRPFAEIFGGRPRRTGRSRRNRRSILRRRGSTMTNDSAGSKAHGVAELASRVRRDLALLNYPERSWLTPRSTKAGAPIYDVVIVGAGQGGLAVAFGLMRERVTNLLVIDENPPGFAGPWRKFARMHTLRTPKYVTGPDLGIPHLTPRAWYEAQHGEGSWETLGLIPKRSVGGVPRMVPRDVGHPGAHRHQGGGPRVEQRRARMGGPLRARRHDRHGDGEARGVWRRASKGRVIGRSPR